MVKKYYGDKRCPKCNSSRAYPRINANDNFCPECNHIFGQAWVWTNPESKPIREHEMRYLIDEPIVCKGNEL